MAAPIVYVSTYRIRAGKFEDSLIGGRGFIAIAAVIFGGWTLKGTVAGCVMFGLVGSFVLTIPSLGYQSIDPAFLAMAPNVITILAMAVFAKRVRQPGFHRGAKPHLRPVNNLAWKQTISGLTQQMLVPIAWILFRSRYGLAPADKLVVQQRNAALNRSCHTHFIQPH